MKRISILIAEDEEEIADLIAIHLEKEGYYCIKVHGWARGCSCCRKSDH